MAKQKLYGIVHRARAEVREQISVTLRERTQNFRAFCGNHAKQLAEILGVSKPTVISWFNSGRISAWGAHEIGKRYPDQWPREYLRPDIINWDAVDLSGPRPGGPKPRKKSKGAKKAR